MCHKVALYGFLYLYKKSVESSIYHLILTRLLCPSLLCPSSILFFLLFFIFWFYCSLKGTNRSRKKYIGWILYNIRLYYWERTAVQPSHWQGLYSFCESHQWPEQSHHTLGYILCTNDAELNDVKVEDIILCALLLIIAMLHRLQHCNYWLSSFSSYLIGAVLYDNLIFSQVIQQEDIFLTLKVYQNAHNQTSGLNLSDP